MSSWLSNNKKFLLGIIEMIYSRVFKKTLKK